MLVLGRRRTQPSLEEDLHFITRQRGVDELTNGATRVYSGEEGGLVAFGEEFLTEALDFAQEVLAFTAQGLVFGHIYIMYLQRKGTKT